MADFAAGSPDLTHPPPLPGLGTGYVETTQESLPVNIGGVNMKVIKKIDPFFFLSLSNFAMESCTIIHKRKNRIGEEPGNSLLHSNCLYLCYLKGTPARRRSSGDKGKHVGWN